ncbi:MAG: DISARM system SNF2-like helicase DrmD [Synergistales bacterium]
MVNVSELFVGEKHVGHVLPQPGQLVEIRRRHWLVADIDAGTVSGAKSGSHLVKLSSIDEDSLGEECAVIWELEPGAQVVEKAGLPRMTGFDDPDECEAFLDAVRWGAATNADRNFLQSPFRSGIAIEDFQLDPLVRAIDMARTNLLIADDVGLGKTIEAGLVVQELIVRHRVRTVFVLCPASLQEKWRVEMLEKFGLDFKIVDTEYLRKLRRERGLHVNPWTSFPRLIASIDWIKQGEGLRFLRDALPPGSSYPRKFDMLIVDEAHNVAPEPASRYSVESQRTRLVRLLSPHFQHKMFLTATPHNGYTESFAALLELLDDQRFSRNLQPDDGHLAKVMVRRLKSDLVDSEGKPLYPRRRLEVLPIAYKIEEKEIQDLLKRYVTLRETRAGEKTAICKFVHQLLKKRLSSSPAAFLATLEKHLASLSDQAGNKKSKGKLEERILRKAIEKTKEDYSDDGARERAEAEGMVQASTWLPPLNEEERILVEKLRAWGQVARNRPDSKAVALLDWLEKNLRPDGNWSKKRVVIFTEYRTTQVWMQAILATHGYGGERLALLYGGMDPKKREAVKAAFQANPSESPVRILLATDAASEGIDLQNHCNLMIHLEIPYNPNVLEQRIGRIDRHGQRESEVVIWHPVDGDGTLGEDILRALRKLENMRADMGSVNPVIAPQLPELLEGRRRELDTRVAETRAQNVKRFVKAERDLREKITKLHEKLLETINEQHFSPSHIQRAVRTALRLSEKPDLLPADLPGAPQGSVFRMPPLDGSWLRCHEGLEHPFSGKPRPITFDHEVARGRDDVVLVHLNHPLVQMSLRLLRAEIWARGDVKKLHRATVRVLPDGRLDSPAAVVISRLVVTGGNHHRLHEELTEAGGYFRSGGFRREEKIGELRSWLVESKGLTAPHRNLGRLSELFERNQEGIWQAVQARSGVRLESLRGKLESQKRREIEDISNILQELAKTLKSELERKEEPTQLVLFTEEEKNQWKRDRAALESRLEKIEEEREKEIEAIENRYSGLTEHTFPVAVVFLLPMSMVSEGRQ